MANLINGIREVWDQNLDQEILLMEFIMRRYTIISFDTEYPGFLRNTPRNASELKIYEDLKFNVDRLNPIQFGFTLFDRTGNVGGTWQINFSDFDTEIDINDCDASTSLSLTKRKSGIDFEKQRREGVLSRSFAHKFGEALKHHANLEWVTFHGLYDFGYLTKVITGDKPLPGSSTGFRFLLGDIFGHKIYDGKFIARFCAGLCGGELGLKRLATTLNVKRIGKCHQAGSDCLVTALVFLKMKEIFNFDDRLYEGFLYALGGRVPRRKPQLQPILPQLYRPVIVRCVPNYIIQPRPVLRPSPYYFLPM